MKDYELTIELAAMPTIEFELYQIAQAYSLDVSKILTLKETLKRDIPKSFSSYTEYIESASQEANLNPIGLRRFDGAMRSFYSVKPNTPFSEIMQNQWLTWRKVQIPLKYEFTKQIIRDNPNLYKTLIQIIQRQFLDQSKHRDLVSALQGHNPVAAQFVQNKSLKISDYPEEFQKAITDLTMVEEKPADPNNGPFAQSSPAFFSETKNSYSTPFDLIDWLDTTQRFQSRRTKKIAEYCKTTYGSYCSHSPASSQCTAELEEQCTKALSFIAEARLQIILRGSDQSIEQCQNQHCDYKYRGILPCEQRFLEPPEMYAVFAHQGKSVPSKLTFDKNHEKSGLTKDSLVYFGNLQTPLINTPVDSPLIANYYRAQEGVRLRKFDLMMLANGRRDPQLTFVINEQLGLDQPQPEALSAESPEPEADSLENITDNNLRDSLRSNVLLDKEKLNEFKEDETIKEILKSYESRVTELKNKANEDNNNQAASQDEEPKVEETQEAVPAKQEARIFFNFLDVDPFSLAINMQENEFEFYKDHVMNYIPVRIAKNTNSHGQTDCLEVLMEFTNPNTPQPKSTQYTCLTQLFKNTDLEKGFDNKIHLTFSKLSLTPKKPIPFSVFK